MVPKKVFFTRGVGRHEDQLHSFELALRDAGIEKQNLVTVSSIVPPDCKFVTKSEGLKKLKQGQITYCVLARNSSKEPSRLIAASIGCAVPKGKKSYGYLSEHHAFGQTEEAASEYSEKLAEDMLATTLAEASIKVKKSNITHSAIVDKKGTWTTVLAAAVFLLE